MPDDNAAWVVIGRIGAPFGLEGWVHLQSYTDSLDGLLEYRPWYLQKGAYQIPITLQHVREHSNNLIVKWVGCDDRNQAGHHRGLKVVVPRSALPDNTNDGFYWVDLEGCEVIETNSNRSLGIVDYLYEGAEDIMVVKNVDGQERHLPFSEPDVVKKVDIAAKRIWVDWSFEG